MAEGSTSEVWCGQHRTLGHRRALKVLRAGAPGSAGRPVQATLRHDNVVPVVEITEHEGQPVLVMPLVEGPTLRTILRERRLTPGEVRGIVEDILAGIAAAHAVGVVHRDLKPENVLLVPSGRRLVAKVTDFGIAALVSDREAGPAWGTEGYAAPEQLRGAPAAPALDYWALGVVAHELLTGRRPEPALAASILDPWEPVLGPLLTTAPEARLTDPQAVRSRLEATGIRVEPLFADPTASFAAEPTAATLPAEPASAGGALPRFADRFVGREALQLEIVRALTEPGVVDLTGPGGVGKTRLAVEAADGVADVVFVDLTETRHDEDVVREVGAALEVDVRAGPHGIRDALRERDGLWLVLDNVEQVVESVRDRIEAWRVAVPTLRVLVTSRVRLGLHGAHTVLLDSLDEAEDLLRIRMAEAAPGLGSVDPTVLAELAVRLDGLPLALELAAAQVRTLAPVDLLEQLTDRFRLLVRDELGTGRHRTLEGTLDWSWSLLGEAERAAVAQLSVFEGGFTLEAAEAVLELTEAPEAVLESLVA
ncbi:MAG: protein kinase, partial [Myxococcota bacterium]